MSIFSKDRLYVFQDLYFYFSEMHSNIETLVYFIFQLQLLLVIITFPP